MIIRTGLEWIMTEMRGVVVGVVEDGSGLPTASRPRDSDRPGVKVVQATEAFWRSGSPGISSGAGA